MGKTSGQYKFVMDCKSDYCKKIQKYMGGRGFDVKMVDNTWLGDHYGIRTFNTKSEAEKEALHLSKKYSDKLYQITVFPP